MESWTVLADIALLLAGSLVLGALCERFLRSAIVGYLLAGMALGPNALRWIQSADEVTLLAELGASLLLFSVGLEFSWPRLRSMGSVPLRGGAAQVVGTAFVLGIGAFFLDHSWKTAALLGMALALSSTASVIKELEVRGLLESVRGGYSIGVLLLQDLAVIPFVLLATSLTQSGESSVWMALGRSLGFGLLAVASLYVLFIYVVPKVLGVLPGQGNRELSVLTAIVGGLASVTLAHEAGISPALGAFIAGMLLAYSPYAVQVRADLSGLRTLFVTIFFSSIGALGDPLWMVQNAGLVLGVSLLIFGAKSALTFGALRLAGARGVSALAAGIGLAQIGEFSFILAGMGRGTLLSERMFLLLVSAAILTMMFTPWMISVGPRLAVWVLGKRGKEYRSLAFAPTHEQPEVILIGFGPAGSVVGEHLREARRPTTVLDLNPKTIERAQKLGYSAMVGDGLHADILTHAGLPGARAVVITVPTASVVMHITRLVRSIAPEVRVIARSRFHRHLAELQSAGAHVLVDEESEVGSSIAQSVLDSLGAPPETTQE